MGKQMRGGQHQTLALMKGLRERGHAMELLARPACPLWAAAQSAGFSVGKASARSVWKQSLAADLVHVHDAHAHTVAAVAARRAFVVSRRVAFPVKSGLLSRWKYRRPARFIAVSQCVRRELEQAGIKAEKIDVVYDGVGLFPKAEATSGLDRVVVSLASPDPDKGRDLVEQAAEIAGIAVTFSSNLERDFERASLFVYATRSEGLGSAALLAMSCGVPVIASSVGGLPEVIEDGKSGLLVPNEPRAIAAAMQRVLNDPELAWSLSRNGLLQVDRKFSWEHMVTATLASYSKALAG